MGDEQQLQDDAPARVVSTVERGLLRAALDFYGTAGAVIDYYGPERPRLRWDLHALRDVHEAMDALRRRIELAASAGLSSELIAGITRLEPELVEMIVERRLDATTGGAGTGARAGED